jgi:hypothetical protein
MIHNLSRGSLLAKCDVKSAFRLLRLAPSEYDLMDFKLRGQYYSPPIKKSSKQCNILLFSDILWTYKCSAVETDSNEAQLKDAPIGKHLSK